jgi:aspartate kinase
VEKGLSLLTVRHYQEEIIQRELRGRKPVLQQATEDTVQALVREEPYQN